MPPVNYSARKNFILREPGRRQLLADAIVVHFPLHQIFVDVCGRTSATLLTKKLSVIEVCNTLHGREPPLCRALTENEQLPDHEQRAPEEIQERMRKVWAEDLEYHTLLARYDQPQTLFWLEFPSQSLGEKGKLMTALAQHRLITQLRKLQGMCILMDQQSEAYTPLEQAGWVKTEADVAAFVCSNDTTHPGYLWLSPALQNRKALPSCGKDIDNIPGLNKRRKAALWYRLFRRELADTALSEAIFQMKQMNKNITRTTLSRASGVNSHYLKNHYSDLMRILQPEDT